MLSILICDKANKNNYYGKIKNWKYTKEKLNNIFDRFEKMFNVYIAGYDIRRTYE